jgi:hypothetical protein
VLLNSLSLASIYTFDLLLLPLVQDQEGWSHRNVGWYYQVLWLLPVVGVAFYLNVGWVVYGVLSLPVTYTSGFDRVRGVLPLQNGHMLCSMAVKLLHNQ